MHVPRPSKETEELFRSVVPEAPGVQVKPMFGNLCAFVNGNMFAGLFGDQLGVRLPDADVRARLLGIEGTGPYGPRARGMVAYVALPEAWKDDPDRLREWIGVALEQVGRMPPKVKKPRKSTAK